MEVPYAKRFVLGGWVLAGWAALAYGVYLTFLALRLPPGFELTGQWVLQPPFKASMALLLAAAAVAHPIARERRWLLPALLFSAGGDWLLAIPWWPMSFVLGLGSFLLAHLCFLAALAPLVVKSPRSPVRIGAVVLMCLSSASLLTWFWPHLGKEKLTVPVSVYIIVLTAMVSAALLAKLPTIWTAVGAVCFAVSDSMIAISRFILGNEALAVPIWWTYAGALILITAGFFFGREDSVQTEVPEPAEAT
ncbi:lysoplasmalogenase [Mycobacterium bourgelatii]|uniref:Putative membrane protein n=1 Tax=Mycobacterium bourgelatii TaxID=1273442 RepID=A0A7I9YNC2_MYCBU|nr:lysoplasmalogenase [Mycobacterium bourgelatii]MCV6976972.1 lysoplasmalogenase [Mycobacterium bourgelatii]GFG90117.1 putative membrane protein [Mycobacterium bourgelatii]